MKAISCLFSGEQSQPVQYQVDKTQQRIDRVVASWNALQKRNGPLCDALPIVKEARILSQELGRRAPSKLTKIAQKANDFAQPFQGYLRELTEKAKILAVIENPVPSQVNQVAALLQEYARYQEASADLGLRAFFSEDIENLKIQFAEKLEAKQAVSAEMTELINQIKEFGTEITTISRIQTAKEFLVGYQRLTDTYQQLEGIYATASATHYSTEPKLCTQAESQLARLQASLFGDLLIKRQQAERILLLENNRELLRSSTIIQHSRNQYEIENGQAACSGISVATMHQLLRDPHAFLDGGSTFEAMLEQGVDNYMTTLITHNEGIAAGNPVRRMILINAYETGGTEELLRAISRDCHGKCDAAKVRQEIGRHEGAEAIVDAILPLIDFTRNVGDYFAPEEVAGTAFSDTMISVTQGQFPLIPGQEPEGYTTMLEAMRERVTQVGQPVGAVLQVGIFIFSVTMYPDGKILIADSHSSEIPELQGFSLILAKDIHEASNLLALHRPVHDIGQQVSHYYLYRLINPETAKPLDAAQFKEPPAAERVLRQAIHRHRHLLNPHDQPLQTNISHFLTAISRDLAIPLDLLAAQFHKGGVDAVMKYYEITTERTHEEIATFIQHKGVPPEALSAYLNGGIQELKAPNPLVAYALCSLTGDTKSLREIEAEWGLSTQDFLHQAYLSSLQEPKTAATARQELQILRQKVTAYQIAKTDALKGEIRSFDKRLPPVLRAYYLHLKGPNPNTPDVLLSKIDTLLGLIPS